MSIYHYKHIRLLRKVKLLQQSASLKSTAVLYLSSAFNIFHYINSTEIRLMRVLR
jgi:hypothetical protein